MDLEKLQKKGAVHIGLKTGRRVLYAYVLEGRPDQIALGWTSSGVTKTPEGPVIDEVVERSSQAVRFLMICHHSSSRELVGKIRDDLTVKGKAALVPEGAQETSSESWFKAKLEDLVYAYPPFAKIFLSEVPSFAEDHEDVDDELEAERRKGLAGGRDKRRRGSGEEDEEEGSLADDLLLRTDRSRTVLSFCLLVGIIIGAAFVGLEQLKRTDGGRAWLLGIEQATGFSFGAKEGFGLGFLSSAELALRAQERSRVGEFYEWYSPARTDDRGNTFGMPKDLDGFQIRTWVDGTPGARTLYAAYRFNPSVRLGPEAPEERDAFRADLAELVDAPALTATLHDNACDVIAGTASLVSDEVFSEVEMLLVHGDEILTASRADGASCDNGKPVLIDMTP